MTANIALNAHASQPRFGALVSRTPGGRVNLGDFVQSLAARQFYPEEPVCVNRDTLAAYDGPPLRLIMNGWFKRHSAFPSAANIQPLLISCHFTSEMLQGINSPECLAYLKAHGPVGCRDLATLRELQKLGVDSYFSGCLTTTLGGTFQRKESDGRIYVVDAFLNHRWLRTVRRNPAGCLRSMARMGTPSVRRHVMRKIFEKIGGSVADVEHVQHNIKPPKATPDAVLFEQARGLLRKYATAKLVITSRIHCALPCLGMGVPVVFINDAPTVPSHMARFGGLIEWMNTVTVNPDMSISSNFDWDALAHLDTRPFNPVRHLPFAQELRARCTEFAR